MTKNLLPVLLITALSSTATAEPTVYYCERTASTSFDNNGTSNPLRLGRFILAIDGVNLRIQERNFDDVYVSEYELTAPFSPTADFLESTRQKNLNFGKVYLTFQNKTLIISRHLENSVFTSIARCENF